MLVHMGQRVLLAHQQNTLLLLLLVAYLIILGVIQAGPRESPNAIQVHYILLGQYLYK